jgi:hypothetical protein
LRLSNGTAVQFLKAVIRLDGSAEDDRPTTTGSLLGLAPIFAEEEVVSVLEAEFTFDAEGECEHE